MRVPLILLACIIGPVRTEIDPVSGQEVLTHLQKYSTCGFLITYPFCIHIWFFWKKQAYVWDKIQVNGVITEVLGTGHWLPGTEQGIYARTPGWRYDRDLGMIRTNGYLGLHWD